MGEQTVPTMEEVSRLVWAVIDRLHGTGRKPVSAKLVIQGIDDWGEKLESVIALPRPGPNPDQLRADILAVFHKYQEGTWLKMRTVAAAIGINPTAPAFEAAIAELTQCDGPLGCSDDELYLNEPHPGSKLVDSGR